MSLAPSLSLPPSGQWQLTVGLHLIAFSRIDEVIGTLTRLTSTSYAAVQSFTCVLLPEGEGLYEVKCLYFLFVSF